jgi:hypothetical protein
MDKPFVGSTLEEQLHRVTKSFITNKEKNRFVPEQQKLEVSKIFDWYKWDFIKSDNSIELFVGKFLFDNADDRDKIRSEKVKLEFLDYDWSLNDLP